MSSLIELSVAAHKAAMRRGTQTPAERRDLAHLPMRVLDGIPVFDANRMRPDQVDDTVATLTRIVGYAKRDSVGDQVRRYMQMYGDTGVRIKDIADHIEADAKGVRRYLREFMETGAVKMREEPTRGGGSPRKRYYWTQRTLPTTADTVEYQPIYQAPGAGTGIIHHGTPNGALQCRCIRCKSAFEDGIVADQESAARRTGANQLAIGAKLRRVRRERQYIADGKALAAGLAARNG